ncbi:DUF3822 family protein [Algoriphagus namhaensis]
MEKHSKVYQSDKFSVALTSNLSLFLYPHALYIFAKDENQVTQAIHVYREQIDDLASIIQNDDLLQIKIPVTVFVHHPSFALIPGGLFKKGEESIYLNYVTEQDENAIYFATGIESNKIQLAGSISGDWHRTLEASFPEVTYHHGASSFLSLAFHERQNLLGQEILLYLFEGKMYAACFTDQELSSFTLFDIHEQQDLIKYPRALMKQHGYNPAHARINVIGSCKNLESSENWGRQYFHQYVTMNPHQALSLGAGIGEVSQLGILEVFWQFEA